MKEITFAAVRNSEEIRIYIEQADASLLALGFTEHSYPHVLRCAKLASEWLLELGFSVREAQLAQIAAYMHDIGNVVNRIDHAQSGAIMAYQLLDKMGMPPTDIASVITAIGNHDEGTAYPVNSVSAALILADKTDVRRSRVRKNKDTANFDIHDRVNYAVESSSTFLNVKEKTLTLSLKLDTTISSVIDYFEIFMHRMLLCRRAANFFNLQFKLEINGSLLM